MSFFWAAVVVVAFSIGIERLSLVSRAKSATVYASSAARILRDPEMEDAAKERDLQELSVRLFTLGLAIVALGALSLLVPLALVWTLDQAGWASFDDVLLVLQRVDFLLAASLVGFVSYRLSRRAAAG